MTESYKYEVLVDDNFHYMDESERYSSGKFVTLEKAEAKCRSIVESFFADGKQTYTSYTMYGEDPFIKSLDIAIPASAFSAWNYAKTIAKK